MSEMNELMSPLVKDEVFAPDARSRRSSTLLDSFANDHQTSRLAGEETLRMVQQIFLSQTIDPPKVVAFAGIDHGNGCSHISASVAVTLAKTSRKPVCLVEANFRSPSLPELFGTSNHFGLTDSLLRKGPIINFVKPVGDDQLSLLSAGLLQDDAPSLLSSERLQERLEELRENFAFVIIDCPPLTRYSDALIMGQRTDGLVLVVEASLTRRQAASVAAANLRSSKVNILAAVLNKRTYPIPTIIYSLL